MQKNVKGFKRYDEVRNKREERKSARYYLKETLSNLGFDYLKLLEYDSRNLNDNKEYHDEVRKFSEELIEKIKKCEISDTKQKYDEMLSQKYILNSIYEYLLEEYDKEICKNNNLLCYYEIEIREFRGYNREDWFKKEKIDRFINIIKNIEKIDDIYIKERLKIEIIAILLNLTSCNLYDIAIERPNIRKKLKQNYKEMYEKLKKDYSEDYIKKKRFDNKLLIKKEFSLFLLQKIRESPNFYKNTYRIKKVYKSQLTQEQWEIYIKLLQKEKITNSEIETLLLYIRNKIEKSEKRNFKKRINFIIEFVEEMKRFNSFLEIRNVVVFKSIYTVLYVENSNYERKSNYKLAKEILENKNLKFKYLDEVKGIKIEEVKKNKKLQNKMNEYAKYLVSEICNTIELYYSEEKEFEEIVDLDRAKVQVLEYILKLPDRIDIIKYLYGIYEDAHYI